MGIFDKFRRAQPAPVKTAVRRFEAAAINRLTSSWMGTTNSINQELRGDLDRLRMRARDLGKNNDYVKKFLRMVGRNVVGPAGFTLQARVMDAPGKPDTLANSAIEGAFSKWAKRRVCEITGKMSFADLCRTTSRCVARDGEALVRVIRGAAANNSFGLALQCLDMARLDTAMNLHPASGRNAVIMGVEVDAYLRPVAYWLHQRNPGDGMGAGQRERVPAGDIIHIFINDEPEQARGVPWMHSAMLRLNNLKGYEEAAIIAARVGAAKMGFFTSKDGSPNGIADEDKESGDFVTDAEAGTFGILPDGYDFKSFDPEYPHALYADFVKATLRGIASGLDVSYNSLANDLEGVNYTSLRAGALEERDQWMTLQNWFIEAFLEPVFDEWIRLALLNQAITMSNGSPLPFTKLDKFSNHAWQGRRWAWVDPQKDIEAARLTIQSGIASPQSIAAQMGMDVEDVLDDIAAFEALVAMKKVTMVSYGANAQAQQPQNPIKNDADM